MYFTIPLLNRKNSTRWEINSTRVFRRILFGFQQISRSIQRKCVKFNNLQLTAGCDKFSNLQSLEVFINLQASVLFCTQAKCHLQKWSKCSENYNKMQKVRCKTQVINISIVKVSMNRFQDIFEITNKWRIVEFKLRTGQ